MAERKFTGFHAALVFGGFFGTIFLVNGVLAWSAISTFPGLEVRNGYVASQEFNTRLAAHRRLGWTVDADEENGVLKLAFTDRQGQPVKVAQLEATVGRPTQNRDDFAPDFQFDGSAYVASVELPAGRWDVRLKALADDGTEFTQKIQIHVVR